MRSHGCCARAPEWRASTRSQRALEFAPAPPTPMLRTCCCWMTCSASLIQNHAAADRSGCAPPAIGRSLNAAVIVPRVPVVFVVEDAQWIDEVSESMLADFSDGDSTDAVAGARHLPARVSGCVDPGARCPDHCPCAAS